MLFNNIKKIKKKYKYYYNLIIGKEIRIKKEINYKKLNNLKRIFFFYNLYKKNIKLLKELKKFFFNIKEKSNLKFEIKENFKKIKKKNKKIKKKINKIIKLLKIKKKKYNEAILEIRSGTGGYEACLFVEDILRMYIMYFNKKKIKYTILNTNKSKIGYKEVILHIKKKDVYNKLKYESGVHRVQRIPKTETLGRLHTSAITIAVLPKLNKVDINIKPKDIKRYTFRSSGAGGQHVNKTESAVRLVHIPTKISVECQEERSQHQNYEKAMIILRSKIYQQNYYKKQKNLEKKRKNLISSGDRSNKIRTYNYPQNRVTDHRLKLSFYNLDKIMNGDLDKLIDKINNYFNK